MFEGSVHIFSSGLGYRHREQIFPSETHQMLKQIVEENEKSNSE